MSKQSFKGFMLGALFAFLCSATIFGIILVTKTTKSNESIDKSNNGGVDKLNTIFNYIDAYYMGDYTKDQLFDSGYAGVVTGLGDVYSAYYTAEEYAKFEEQTSGTFVGIGSYVSIDEETKYPCLTKPIKDGPAERAGIKPGDLLVEIDGESCYNMDLDIAVSKIKGEKDTQVQLTIYREGEPEYLHFTITREEVTTITVESEMLDNNIGYIQVTNFAEKTGEQFAKSIEELTSGGMTSLIIDLRSNPGGYLNVAVDMCDSILPSGKIVTYTENKNGSRVDYKTINKDEVNVPIVVLIDKNSASASEVFTGCLKDYDKITVIGEKSFGKGIVQSIYPLADGSRLKLTTAYYYSPNGTNIHGTGIEPDISAVDDTETEVDEVIEKAKEYLSK